MAMTTTTTLEMTLGERLAYARKKAGMRSQSDMADILGVSKALIGFWEQDERTPTLGQLVKWASATDVGLNWLAGRDDLEALVDSVGTGHQLALRLFDRVRLSDITPIEKAAKKRSREAKPSRRCDTALPAQGTYSAA